LKRLACIVLFCAAGCHKSVDAGSGIVFHTEISPQPVRVGPAAIVVDLADSAGAPVRAANIVIEGVMSHAGMAPVFGQSKESGPGRYRGHLTFSMAGDWTILLHVTLADGTKLERQMGITRVRAN